MKYVVLLSISAAALFLPVSYANAQQVSDQCFGNPSTFLLSVFDEQGILAQINTSRFVFGARLFFMAFVVFAIAWQVLRFFEGHADWKGMVVRLLIISFLLHEYNDPTGYRHVIRKGAEDFGVWIRDGEGPESLISRIGIIFNRVMGIEQGDGWLSGILTSFEAGVKLIFTLPGWMTIFFVLISVFVSLMSFFIDAGQIVLFLILEILGPYCLAFGVFPPTERIAWGWITRWIEISLWTVVASIILVAITAAYGSILSIMPKVWVSTSLTISKCNLMGMFMMIVLGFISLFMLISVPAISASIAMGRSMGFSKAIAFATGFLPSLLKGLAKRAVLKGG